MEKKNIVVIGAGFGGIAAAIRLETLLRKENLEAAYSVILINRSDRHLYTPALYELAAMPREDMADRPLALSIQIPLETILREKRISFICDEFTGLDPEGRKIKLEKAGDLAYEYAILALGSETNYFSIPGLEAGSVPLKTCADAVRLRNLVEAKLKEKETLTMIIGGAGPSGIELAAETVNFACAVNERNPQEKKCVARIVLVEAAPDILPGFSPAMVAAARKRLQRLGVEIKTGSAIESVDEARVSLKGGEREPYDVLVWTGGVKGPKALASAGLALTPKGTVAVNELLEATSAPFVFAVGDNAGFVDPRTGKPVPWSVPIAENEAKTAAENIIAAIQGRPKKPFRPLARYPFVLTLGGKYAAGDFIFFRLDGILGWFSKRMIELRYYLSLLSFGEAFALWRKNMRLFEANDR